MDVFEEIELFVVLSRGIEGAGTEEGGSGGAEIWEDGEDRSVSRSRINPSLSIRCSLGIRRPKRLLGIAAVEDDAEGGE